jgi:hypothetical protein
LAKIGLSIVSIFFLLRIFVVVYIYFKYDRKISKIQKSLPKMREKHRSHTIVQSIIDARIAQDERDAKEKLDLLESGRMALLDRINLFISFGSIK